MKSATPQSTGSTLRRGGRVLAVAMVLLVAVGLLALVTACGGSSGSSNASPSTGAIKMGGVLKIGSQPGNINFDPALFAGAVPDILLQQQVYEKLVTLGQDFSVQPTLATKWDSPGGKVWTFTLRDGITFSNGQPFTSADVVYTMNRLRSKKLGSPMADIYANITSVVATGPTTVTFTLKKVDSEFPASLTDYRTLMLCKSVKNPAKQAVGTGPFTLKSISAEDRAILMKNPTYWGKDAQGNQLPYLDEVDFIYSPDIAGQVEGLQGGSLNWVGGLSSEQKLAVDAGHDRLAHPDVAAGLPVAADLPLEAVVGLGGHRLQAGGALDRQLLLGGEATDPVERATLQAFHLAGDVRRVDEIDFVEVRELVALGVLAPVGRVLHEDGAVLGRDGLERERAGADRLLRRVLDRLAEHQRAVVGERGGELGVDLLEREGDGRGASRHDARDVGVDVGHRRAELLAAQASHRVHHVGGRERLTVAERDAVAQREGPDLAV